MSGVEDMIYVAEQSLGLGEPNYIQDWYRQRNGPAFAGNFPWRNAAVTYRAWPSGNQDAGTFGAMDYMSTPHPARRHPTMSGGPAPTSHQPFRPETPFSGQSLRRRARPKR